MRMANRVETGAPVTVDGGLKSFQFPFKELYQLAPAPGTGYGEFVCLTVYGPPEQTIGSFCFSA